MGKVNQLFQADRQARWQEAFDDYVFDNFGGREVEGRDYDEACDYAESMMEEEDD